MTKATNKEIRDARKIYEPYTDIIIEVGAKVRRNPNGSCWVEAWVWLDSDKKPKKAKKIK